MFQFAHGFYATKKRLPMNRRSGSGGGLVSGRGPCLMGSQVFKDPGAPWLERDIFSSTRIFPASSCTLRGGWWPMDTR